MLDSHREIAFASDPFSRIFKSLRNALSEQAAIEIDPTSPLNDYYFSPQGIRLLADVRSVRWSEVRTDCNGEGIAQAASVASMPYSPDLSPYLCQLRGPNFHELLVDGLRLVKKVYGCESTRVVGFKEVWTTEFVPGFLHAFPEGRVVCLIRDPRAVYLSKWKQKERYPLLFMARQWRKLAALAWLWGQDPVLSDRILLMRYEDLIANPKGSAIQLADLIGIGDSSSMIDPKSWTDGGGGAWKQNTSFGEGSHGFDVNAADRWKTRLPESEARLIESLCAPEMALFDYEPLCEPWSESLDMITNPSQVPSDLLASWIRPHVDESMETLSRAYLMERMRSEYLSNGLLCDDELKSLLCLHPDLFSICQNLMTGIPSK